MYSKEEIWNSFANEIRIIKHLATKIPPESHNHRPTEKQRSLHELLQYISMMGSGIMDTVYTGDVKTFSSYVERSKTVTVETFIEAMDTQAHEMEILFAKFDEAVLETELSLWGMTKKKSLFILHLLQMMTAYKMQLFLYIKASGNHAIGTANLWAGMDMPQV